MVLICSGGIQTKGGLHLLPAPSRNPVPSFSYHCASPSGQNFWARNCWIIQPTVVPSEFSLRQVSIICITGSSKPPVTARYFVGLVRARGTLLGTTSTWSLTPHLETSIGASDLSHGWFGKVYQSCIDIARVH